MAEAGRSAARLPVHSRMPAPASTSPGGRCPVEKVANDIGDAAGLAEVEALDERAVAGHADAVAADAGGIDIALNAVSFPFVHDTPLAQLAFDDVMHPIDAYLRTNLITAMAAARHMTAQRSGTILTLSAGASRVLPPGESRLRHHVRGYRDDDPAPRGRRAHPCGGTGWRARLVPAEAERVASRVEVDPPLGLIWWLHLVAAGAQGQDLGLRRRQVTAVPK
jgi:NAD(P)-dependent dehydrogenase (short-subunit alcohol dehydrogenase family)